MREHERVVEDRQRPVVIGAVDDDAHRVLRRADIALEGDVAPSQRLQSAPRHPRLLQQTGTDHRDDTGVVGPMDDHTCTAEGTVDPVGVGFVGDQGPLAAGGGELEAGSGSRVIWTAARMASADSVELE